VDDLKYICRYICNSGSRYDADSVSYLDPESKTGSADETFQYSS